ncbi:PD-(D/E)XK nuclease family protein [Litorimonas sp. RW-G-Af-16]|uniref:PD-(D/E)XK nuclease family protein n=1 Tax=Litorimonas sp. RW-G-Af-16 TaxID=3241168 RepID=UPI00390C8BF0
MSGAIPHPRHVYNMPSGVPFLQYLAEGLSAHYGDALQDALILLPTRRAVQGMRDALTDLAQSEGRGATLLPRMKPLADINPEEPPFEPGELIGEVAPAMPPMQRRFEMAKLVTAYHRRAADLPLDPATALALADPLLAIFDDAAMEEVTITDTDEWKNILSESALHFQHAATLYQIIEEYWPARLAEIGMIETQARKVKLLNLLTDSWREAPPRYPVIIAGSTGTLSATARLMACVAELPQGMVVLPGLQASTDQAWDTIDVQHPQYSLKSLLERMKMDRGDVIDWRKIVPSLQLKPTGDLPVTDLRRMVINEALVAVDKTSDWLGRIETLQRNHGDDIFNRAMDGLSLIEAPNDEDEAMSIALILRHALETPKRTAALVTPDQGLARRVQARLGRWGISVDMSQGEPLSQTPIGGLLLALLQLAHDPEGPVEISVVMHHPLCALTDDPNTWPDLEKAEFRGIRPHFTDATRPELVTKLYAAIAPLLELDGKAPASIWASALVSAAEAVSEGGRTIWAGLAGAQAGQLLTGLISHGAELPDTNSEGIIRLIHRMLQNTVVKQDSSNQARLSILGPLEARLIAPDVVILGGLNEGTWPASPSVDPFLSRSMRRAMSLSLPERRYGLSAHDFAELAANPCVYLTRSERNDSGPTVAARWVWRLQTLLAGALGEGAAKRLLQTGQTYLTAAQSLDYVAADAITPAEPPLPKPPVDKRWSYYRGKLQPAGEGRRISMTGVQTWIRDPYAIYAKHCLGLEGLDDLDMAQDARHFGTALHAAIETFLIENQGPYDISQSEILLDHIQTQFKEHHYAPEIIHHEMPRFNEIARQFLAWLKDRDMQGFEIVGQEVYANYTFATPPFRLTGVADLIERSPEGYAFIDFKTGVPSTNAVVTAGFDPQLPLAAFLAKNGAFKDQPKGETTQLGYLQLKGANKGFSEQIVTAPHYKSGKDAMTLAAEAEEILKQLITEFDTPETGYPSQPRVQYQNKYGDYDHLARRAEWRGIMSGDGEGDT